MTRHFLCTLLEPWQTPYCRWVQVDADGWVEGETPIEDLAPYVLLDHEVTAEEAVRLREQYLDELGL